LRRFREEVTNWIKGAITADSPDQLPKDASPRARNTAFLRFGQPAKRKGMTLITPTGETGGPPKPAILAIDYASLVEDTINWAIFDSGKWSKQVAGAWEPIDSGNATPFTSGQKIYSTAIAKGHLFAVNGTDMFKTDGQAIFNFGLERPDAPTLANSVGAFNPDGDYLIALTRYNENTGHESSLSDSERRAARDTAALRHAGRHERSLRLKPARSSAGWRDRANGARSQVTARPGLLSGTAGRWRVGIGGGQRSARLGLCGARRRTSGA
jgi:hypothetical protein